MASSKLVQNWAICQYYESSKVGDDGWRRYQVESENINLSKGIKGFVFFNPFSMLWQVHERFSGAGIASANDHNLAIAEANHVIEKTPDLKMQIAKLGDASKRPQVPAIEAMERIAKSNKLRRDV